MNIALPSPQSGSLPPSSRRFVQEGTLSDPSDQSPATRATNAVPIQFDGPVTTATTAFVGQESSEHLSNTEHLASESEGAPMRSTTEEIPHPNSISSSGKRPLLTSVWLDADHYTYEALCTAGAASITVMLGQSDQPTTPTVNSNTVSGSASQQRVDRSETILKGANADLGAVGMHQASVSDISYLASSRVQQLIPHENAHRRRQHGSLSHSGVKEKEKNATRWNDANSFSREEQVPPFGKPRALPPSDADVRLDVLEEVELCSVIPRLSRTFGVDQLVQQIVPCTAYFAQQNSRSNYDSSNTHAVGGALQCSDELQPRPTRYLQQLRDAADTHLLTLRSSTNINSEYFQTRSQVDDNAQERNDGNEETSCYLRRQPCRPVSAWLPPIPADMKGTVQNTPSSISDNHVRSPSIRDSRERNDEGRLSQQSLPPFCSSVTPPLHVSLLSDFDIDSVDVCDVNAADPASQRKHDLADPRKKAGNLRQRSGSNEIVLSQLADGVEDERNEEEEGGAVNSFTTAESAPRCPTERDAEVKVQYEAAEDFNGYTATSSRASSRGGRAVSENEQKQLQREHELNNNDYDGSVTLCLTFAAAQALYERQRLFQACDAAMGSVTVPKRAGSGENTNRAIGAALPSASPSNSRDKNEQIDGAAVSDHAAVPASPSFSHYTHEPSALVATAKWTGEDGTGSKTNGDSAVAALSSRADSHKNSPRSVSCNAWKTNTRTEKQFGESDTETTVAAARFWSSTTAYFAPLTPTDPFASVPGTTSGHFEPFTQADPALDPIMEGVPINNSDSDISKAATSAATGAVSSSQMPLPSFSIATVHRRSFAQPAGAIVEWGSGVVSYTADAEGLMQEQQARAQRFFSLPPPLPCLPEQPSGLIAQDVAANKKNDHQNRELHLESKEDRSTLRGAVLAQLQRLHCSSEAVTAYCHGTDARVSERYTAVCSGEVESTVPRPSRPNSSGSSKNDNYTSSKSALPCSCHHCSPLQLQFAQVPSMDSPVLLRYLDLLHQTALPSLQNPCPSPRCPRTGRASGQGITKAGARSKEVECVLSPATNHYCHHHKHSDFSSNSNSSSKKGAGRNGRRDLLDPIDLVFPALQQWFTQVQKVDAALRSPSPSVSPQLDVDNVQPIKDEEREEEEDELATDMYSQTHVTADLKKPTALLQRSTDANGAPMHFSAPNNSLGSTTKLPTTTVVSLDWLDDAVLDETVVVGVMPRGQPHALRLVAPSRAFVLTLTLRLEEVSEVALRVLANISLPAEVTRWVEAAVAFEPSPPSAQKRLLSTVAKQWQAWLEEVYFAAMWDLLRGALSVREWFTVVQQADMLPFLPSPSTLSSPSLTENKFRLPAFLVELLTQKTSLAGNAVLNAVEKTVKGVFDSVRSAATTHTTACLSSAEDATTRVMLTALTPLLHRRITVMYELLRHFASRSLYASHRQQCESYQLWYATTPSPGAVLRLLQRSRRFHAALARCYPQYRLTPLPSPHVQDVSSSQQQQRGSRRKSVRSSESASHEFPSLPLTNTTISAAALRNGARQRRELSAAGGQGAAAAVTSMKRRREDESMKSSEGLERDHTKDKDDIEGNSSVSSQEELYPSLAAFTMATCNTSTGVATTTVAGDANATTPISSIPCSPASVYTVTPSKDSQESRWASPDFPTTAATATVTEASTAAAPPATAVTNSGANGSASNTNYNGSSASPQTHDLRLTAAQSMALVYVPEVALLDPRYLQRFAWWTHRTYHNSSNSGCIGIYAPTGGGGVGAGHAHSPVMSIPGDYLRVLPLQEQDAGIRAVLRSMSQKGRTLDLWEISHYIQTHRNTSYVYH